MINVHHHPRFRIAPQQVVAAVHTKRGLELAKRLTAETVDYIEIRLDALGAVFDDPAKLIKAIQKISAPLLITARDPREGGVGGLSWPAREALLLEMLPYAAGLDLELRNCEKGAALLAKAREAGVGVVLSAHNFRRTPSLPMLRQMATRAAQAEADIFKFAGTANRSSEFAMLLNFLTLEKKLPLAVMGMGIFGKVSRLTLGAAGSVLNYGYLDAANATGQWPAPLLKKRLQELTA